MQRFLFLRKPNLLYDCNIAKRTKVDFSNPLNVVSKGPGGRPRPWTPIPGLKRPKYFDTGGTRNAILPDFVQQGVYTGDPEPSLSVHLPRKSGRCKHTGKIVIRHKGGGGWRRIYRVVDFKRSILNHEGVVERIEYDPNRSGYVALVRYPTLDDTLQYILAPHGLKAGNKVMSVRHREPKDFLIGCSMPLKWIPDRSEIFNIELVPGAGAKFVRAAGTTATLLNKGETRAGYAHIKLPSKESRLILLDCCATIGQVSNVFRKVICWGKAGIRRKFGERPEVRGISMNPVNHPHGGGTGKKKAHKGGAVSWKGRYRAHGQKTKREWRRRLPRFMQMVVEDRLRYVRGPRGRLRKRDCYKRWLAVQERRKEKMEGIPDKKYKHHT